MKGFKHYSFNVIYEHNVGNAGFAVTNVKRTAIMEETTKVLGGCIHHVKKVCGRRPRPTTPLAVGQMGEMYGS